MNHEERHKLYEEAILKWGEQAQLEMAMEESIELALAIRKEIRNNSEVSFTDLVNEVADMEIMIEQLHFIYKNNGFKQMVEHQKDFKLNRLKERLENK